MFFRHSGSRPQSDADDIVQTTPTFQVSDRKGRTLRARWLEGSHGELTMLVEIDEWVGEIELRRMR